MKKSMRWVPFILLLYLTAVVQTTVGGVLTINTVAIGPFGPDLLAVVAVFVALHARSGLDVVLAAWAGGMAIDLTAAGGVDSVTVLGPMSLTYVLAATVIYRIRDAFFRERPLPQAILTLLFCVMAHPLWVTLQSLLAGRATVGWPLYIRRLWEAAAVSLYTAALAPLLCWGLGRLRGWIFAAGGEARRKRQ